MLGHRTHYVNMKNRTACGYKQFERQIRVNRDIFPTFWNMVVIWTIVLLFRSWCYLFTTLTNVWQIQKECTARIVIFHCRFLQTGARHHDVSLTVFSTVFHSFLELQRKGKVIPNRFPYPLTLKEKLSVFPKQPIFIEGPARHPMMLFVHHLVYTGTHSYNSVFPVLPARVIVKRKLMMWKLKFSVFFLALESSQS